MEAPRPRATAAAASAAESGAHRLAPSQSPPALVTHLDPRRPDELLRAVLDGRAGVEVTSQVLASPVRRARCARMLDARRCSTRLDGLGFDFGVRRAAPHIHALAAALRTSASPETPTTVLA